MSTLKAVLRELNHTQKTRELFPKCKQLNMILVSVQVELARLMLEELKGEEQKISNKEFNDIEIGAMISHDKVKGIKSLRERLGMGLGEAKNYFEEGCVRLGYARWDMSMNYKQFQWK